MCTAEQMYAAPRFDSRHCIVRIVLHVVWRKWKSVCRWWRNFNESNAYAATDRSRLPHREHRRRCVCRLHKAAAGSLQNHHARRYARAVCDQLGYEQLCIGRAAGFADACCPAGFKVQLYATGLLGPRHLATAPNGDIFVSESGGNRITVLRGVKADGSAETTSVFTGAGLNYPFGLTFYPTGATPQYVYIANTNNVIRIPYSNGDAHASGASQVIASLPSNGGHATRTLAFLPDGRLLVTVGSASNITNTDTDNSEDKRADVLAFSATVQFLKVYASGLRNAVGLAIDSSGGPWVSVNERDGLGDNLPPDFVTHITEDGFYGWPWYYIGNHADPRLPNNHPELAAKTITPDVLLEPHFAPLQIAFYNGSQFPSFYKGDLFAASHGSWNRANRGGYELVRVIVQDGKATGVHEDFMTGFVNADGTVWGRPVGVTAGTDGALYVSDDVSNSIWRITYTGG